MRRVVAFPRGAQVRRTKAVGVFEAVAQRAVETNMGDPDEADRYERCDMRRCAERNADKRQTIPVAFLSSRRAPATLPSVVHGTVDDAFSAGASTDRQDLVRAVDKLFLRAVDSE
jgi:hypothetical protein